MEKMICSHWKCLTLNPVDQKDVNLIPSGWRDLMLNHIGWTVMLWNPLGRKDVSLIPYVWRDLMLNPIGGKDVKFNPIGWIVLLWNPIGGKDAKWDPIGWIVLLLNPIGGKDATWNPIGWLLTCLSWFSRASGTASWQTSGRRFLTCTMPGRTPRPPIKTKPVQCFRSTSDRHHFDASESAFSL